MRTSTNKEQKDEQSSCIPSRKQGSECVLWYMAIGLVWLISSNWLIRCWFGHGSAAMAWDFMGDGLFVAITGAMLFSLQSRYLRHIQQSAQRLQISERHLRLVTDSLPGSYIFQFVTREDGKPHFTYISAGVERVHGVKAEHVLLDSDCLWRLVLPELKSAFAVAEADSVRNSGQLELEIPVQHPDGTDRLIHLRSLPQRIGDGTVQWVGLATDITMQKHAVKALQHSEEKFRQLAENINDVFWMAAPQMSTMQYVSPNYEHIWGRSVESLYAHPQQWMEAIVSEDREKVLDAFAALAEDQKEVGVEYRITRPDGSVRWIHDRGFQIRSMEGNLIGRGGIATDITDHKQSEMALRLSEERFRVMFEAASIGMAESNPKTGQFLWINGEMCRITGYSAEELRQMRFSAITHPDDREADWNLFQQVLRNEQPEYRVQKRYIRKDGKIIWVSVNATVIRDAMGHPMRAMASVEDITVRKAAEDERMRLVTAMEQSAESIMITDTAGIVLYVNPAFEQISGYTRAEVLGKNPRMLKSGTQDAAFYRNLWETLTHGEVWHGHLVNRRKDGTFYEEDATISPVRDSTGNVVNYVAIKLDITHEAELENRLRQMQKMEAIGQLAGGVAHDFNNIIAALMMQADLTAESQNLPEEAQEGLKHIHACAERAANLTRQLLLFSRKQVMQPRDLDFNEIVTSLAKMLQRIIGEDVHLQLHLHPTPLMIHADPGMMDQILMNLAVNARDAMPHGGQLLIKTAEQILDASVTQLHPDVVPGPYACLSVVDTGDGIAPEILPHIFEPFFTTKEQGKGTGLGLATVFGIVKQHRGWINVASEPNKGANFQVFIPMNGVHCQAGQKFTPPRPRGGTETILVVEDDIALRNMTRKLLERNGYRVLEASNGLEALKLWQAEHNAVALLLTDLVMPSGIDGRELARTLRADKPGLKVVLTSGYSAEIAGREVRFEPGEHFLQKPLQSDELLKTVRTCLDE